MRKFFIYLLVFLLVAGAATGYCGYRMFYGPAVTEDFSVRITPKTD